MSKEAMKLALEALEIFEAAGQWTRYSRDSITARKKHWIILPTAAK